MSTIEFQVFFYIAFTLFVLACMGLPKPVPKPATELVHEPATELVTELVTQIKFDPVQDPWQIELDFEPIHVYLSEPQSLPALEFQLCLPPAPANEPQAPACEPDFTKMSAKALKEYARDQGVKNWWKLNKASLIDALNDLAQLAQLTTT